MTTDRRSTKARPDTVNFLIEQRRTESRLHPPPDFVHFTPLSDRFTGFGGSTQSTSNNISLVATSLADYKQTKQIKQKYKQDEGLRQAIACARTAGRVCTPAAAGLALVLLNPACVLVLVGADERRLQQAAQQQHSSRSSSSGCCSGCCCCYCCCCGCLLFPNFTARPLPLTTLRAGHSFFLSEFLVTYRTCLPTYFTGST